MVAAMGPGKFYGSDLPRPQIYTETKLNPYRVDPPVSATDALLSWASEAHWSMGGLSFKRLRLQGKIEGNVKRLKSQREKSVKEKESKTPSPAINRKPTMPSSVSPPLAVMLKKRRRVALIDEDEEEEEVVPRTEERPVVRTSPRRKPARKLSDEFDRVASESVGRKEKEGEVRVDGVVEKRRIGFKKTKMQARKEVRVTLPAVAVAASPKVRTSPRLSASK